MIAQGAISETSGTGNLRRNFGTCHPSSRQPTEVPVSSDRVFFRIKGNKYRLVVRVDYQRGLVYVRFVGTHTQDDTINAAEV